MEKKFIKKFLQLQSAKMLHYFQKSNNQLNAIIADELAAREHTDNDLHLDYLSPFDDVKSFDTYRRALDYSLEEDKVQNIALSGAYGVGKSSVLETYKSKHSNKKVFFHISMAHFKEQVNDEKAHELQRDSAEYDATSENNLERKIINQLIHQISPWRIPKTRFQVTKKNNWVVTIGWWSAIVVELLFLFCVIKIPFFHLAVIHNLIVPNKMSLTIWTIGAVVVLAFVILVLILKIRNRQLMGTLNLKGSKIELKGDAKLSYFDSYLDDIVYLFEHSGADVIVFEDIDRFDKSMIFEKLREINNVVNRSKTKIKFMYLIKDDIFRSKDRTKFFDFILPVVPFVDASNSYEELAEYQKDENSDIDRHFLHELSLFIDDYRLLKNIKNEYKIYVNNLDFTGLKQTYLLSMITLKNILPKEFDDLRAGRGFLYTIFNKRDEPLKQEIERLAEAKRKILPELTRLNAELVDDLTELQALYVPVNGYLYYEMDGRQVGYAKPVELLTHLKEIEKFKRNIINSNQSIYHNAKLIITFEDLVKEIENNKDYMERKDAAEDRGNGRIKIIENKINDLERRINSLKNDSIHSLMNSEDYPKLFLKQYKEDYPNEENDKILDFFIFILKEGHFDENFDNYTTKFDPKSITPNDNKYIRNVRFGSGNVVEMSLKLKTFDEIFELIDKTHFEKPAIINLSMGEYLINEKLNSELKDEDKHSDFLPLLFKRVHASQEYDYYALLYDQLGEDGRIEFLNMVLSMDANLFHHLNLTSDEKVQAIFLFVVNHENLIKLISTDNTYHVARNTNVFDQLNNDQSKLLNDVGMTFDVIDTTNQTVVSNIYENDLYEITQENVEAMIKFKLPQPIFTFNRIMTMLEDSKLSTMRKYVHANAEQFKKNILFNEDIVGRIEDDQQILISVLNNAELLTLDEKFHYMRKQTNPVEKLKQVKDDGLWEKLLEADMLLINEENIIYYFTQLSNEWTEVLLGKVNAAPQVKYTKEYFQTLSKDDNQIIFDKTIIQNKMNDSSYKEIMNATGIILEDDVSELKVGENKLRILVDVGVISMTDNNLMDIRENYPELLNYFVRNNSGEYIEISKNAEVRDNDELKCLINELTDLPETQLKLMNLYTGVLSVKNKALDDDGLAEAIDNHFDVDEIHELEERYNNANDNLKEAIVNRYAAEYGYLFENEYEFHLPDLFSELMSVESLSNEQKYELLSMNIELLPVKKVANILSAIGRSDIGKLFDTNNTTKPKFDETAANVRFVDYLIDHKFLSSKSSIGGNRIQVFPPRRR